MNTDEIHACMKLSFADTPFPKVVGRLLSAGVRAYRVDLVLLRATYYDGADGGYDHALPLENAPKISGRFDAPAVADAVRAIQQGKLGYAKFLRRIMRAGCASYAVFIAGAKVDYVGRDGQIHTEHFPGAKT